MKKNKIKWIAIALVCSLLLSSEYVWAADYEQQIQQAEEQQKEYEKKASDWQKQMEDLEKDKENTLTYIEKTDKKLGELEQSLKELEEKLQKENEKLALLKEQTGQAQEEEEKQYITMKQRIKYMYENGNQGYWDLLFGSKNITEFLSRSEYVEKISNYDNQVFQRYQEAKQNVQKKQKEVENKVTELRKIQEETEVEKGEVKELKEGKEGELRAFEKRVDKSKEKVEIYTKQAIAAENEVEELLRKKQEEREREQGVGAGTSDGDITKTGLIWPLKNGAGKLSSVFGPRKRPTAGASTYHKGIDLGVAYGTPIVAAGSGKVVTATYSSSAGNFVMISHGNRMYTVYMHCSRLAVSAGDTVIKGQVIAYVGSTGISTGSHLHFGISKNGKYVNPLMYVSR